MIRTVRSSGSLASVAETRCCTRPFSRRGHAAIDGASVSRVFAAWPRRLNGRTSRRHATGQRAVGRRFLVGILAAAVLLASARVVSAVDAPAGRKAPNQAERILHFAAARGGLIVHLGCGSGRLTAALRANESCVVHGLDADAENVAAARKHIRSLGLAGDVTVERWTGSTLPHTDNLVNLLVAEDPGGVSRRELMRVLVPGGAAYVQQEGKWTRSIKPWPDDIDQWTHFLYDATGNAVAKDRRVAPPNGVQWLAGPKRTRDHDALASLSAMTSSGGRIFYILDEGPTSLIHHPPQWKLIARDAFNGVVLWRRDVPSWITHLYYFRSGPVWLARRLVSTGDRVYTTLGLEAPVAALDAATGKTLRTYRGSDKAEEILYHDGTLLVAVGDPALMNRQAKSVWLYSQYTVEGTPPDDRAVLAYRADTGELLWKKGGKDVPYLLPLSLTACGDRVFYMDGKDVCCVDLATGRPQWRAPFATQGLFLRNYSPTVVAADGVLLCLTMDRLAAFSIEDGRELWETKGYKGFTSPGDLFVVDGIAWTLPVTQGGVRMEKDRVLGDGGQKFQGFDVHTGKVKKTFLKKDVWPAGHHHRCYRNKATERFLVTSRRGLEFIDLAGDGHVMNWWIRGICQYGLMPCNGLVYVPPDPCQCFNLVKVDGFYALRAESSLDRAGAGQHDRLITGPAYSLDAKPQAAGILASKAEGMIWHPPVGSAAPDDWPTYRHDVTRSGRTSSAVAGKLAKQWASNVGGKLTSPVLAAGKLLVGSIDRNTVHCLRADDGRQIWQFTAGGSVDSPPTISGERVLFGSRDGHVYAVRLADGQLDWRFRAAPTDRRIMADGRLESVWPVHGSVLVLDGDADSKRVVYCAAGRSSYLDGGMFLYGLDVASGKKLYETRVYAAPGPIGNEGPSEEMTPALPDVLVSNGTSINMRHVRFDRTLTRRPGAGMDTLTSSTGLLEDCWGHRCNTSLGVRGSIDYRSHNGRLRGSPANPFGKLIVFDDKCAYAVQSMYTFLKHSPSMYPAGHQGHLHQKYTLYKPQQFPIGVRLYAQDNSSAVKGQAAGRNQKKPPRQSFTSTVTHKWNTRIPLQIRAMVLAGDTIFAAGWIDSVKIYEAADTGSPDAGAPRLWIMSTDDGRKLGEVELDAQPVFDGLIAAAGRLYMTMQDGKVICLGEQ